MEFTIERSKAVTGCTYKQMECIKNAKNCTLENAPGSGTQFMKRVEKHVASEIISEIVDGNEVTVSFE